MKKTLAIPALVGILLIPTLVLAQDPWAPLSSPADLIVMLDTIARWLMTILLIVAAIFIVIAAYRFVTSGGDPAGVTAARQSIMYALIGVAVAFLAWGIVQVVKTIVNQ